MVGHAYLCARADGDELMAAATPPAGGRREVSALMGRRTKDIPAPPPLTTPTERPVPDGRKDAGAGRESVVAGPADGPAAGPQSRLVPGDGGADVGRPTPRPSAPPRGRRGQHGSRVAAKLADDQVRPVAAYLPVDLRAGVVEEARRSGLTLAEWLLDTYDQVFERLDRLYGAGELDAAPRRSGLPQRRTRRRSTSVGVQMQFGLTGTELQVLEEHMSRLQVASRSEFFTIIAQMGLDRPV